MSPFSWRSVTLQVWNYFATQAEPTATGLLQFRHLDQIAM